MQKDILNILIVDCVYKKELLHKVVKKIPATEHFVTYLEPVSA
jgi:hypothetical protein